MTELTAIKVTLHSLAAVAYQEADGNVAVATAAIVRMLHADPKMMAEIVEAAVKNAVGHAVSNVATQHRAAIIKLAQAPVIVGAGRASITVLANGLKAAMMDWPLANGVKLRNATRADLADTIGRYQADATTSATRASWLTLVMQSVPEGETVGNRLSEERLKELYNEVAKS